LEAARAGFVNCDSHDINKIVKTNAR
jgi:hypothetical protein